MYVIIDQVLSRDKRSLLCQCLRTNSFWGWWTTVYFTLLDSRSIQSAANVVRDERRVKLNKIELPCVRPSPREGVIAIPACWPPFICSFLPGVGSGEHALTVSFSNAISISKRITREARSWRLHLRKLERDYLLHLGRDISVRIVILLAKHNLLSIT